MCANHWVLGSEKKSRRNVKSAEIQGNVRFELGEKMQRAWVLQSRKRRDLYMKVLRNSTERARVVARNLGAWRTSLMNDLENV
jgi:hypothetical protein